MSLINCPECGTEVSDQAEKCPKCAYPITNNPTNLDVPQLIELTNKKYKIQKIYIILLLVIGFLITGATMNTNPDLQTIGQGIGLFCILGSIIWAIIVKIQIWWNHR